MTEKPVSAETVIAIYSQKLTDAHHTIVMLQASIIKLEEEIEELNKTLEEKE